MQTNLETAAACNLRGQIHIAISPMTVKVYLQYCRLREQKYIILVYSMLAVARVIINQAYSNDMLILD